MNDLLTSRRSYSTDLTDKEWAILKPFMPPSLRRGRPQIWPMRCIVDAIFYVLRSGCAWRLLPHDFPPWQSVYYHFRKLCLSGAWYLILKALRMAERQRLGRDPQPTAAVMDSQSVRTSAEAAGSKGHDAHKHVNGRKRHLLVDTSGFPLSVYVTPANVQDRAGARCLLAGLGPLLPRLKKIWADGAYSGKELAEWCEDEGGWELEVVRRDRGARGFRFCQSAGS